MSRQPLGDMRRQEQICALFTKEEKQKIEHVARQHGMPPAVFVRQLVMAKIAIMAA
jgi:hypothetical protein